MIQSLLKYGLPKELEGNILAANLFSFVEREKKLPPLPFFRGINWNESPVVKLSDGDSSLTYRDFRFSALMLKCIRKYGIAPHFLYYGIDFKTAGNPHSLILLGRNGSGKTSLFAGMEKVGKGRSNIATLRGYDSTRESQFFSHGNMPLEQSWIKLSVGDGVTIKGKVDDLKNENIPEACFSSDFDVEQLEKVDNYSAFIWRQIGVETLSRVIDLLDDYKAGIIDDYERGDLPENDFSLRKQQAENLRGYFADTVERVKMGIGPKLKEMMECIVNDYFDEYDGERFLVSFDSNSFEFSFDIEFKTSTVNSSGDSDATLINLTPRQYLNTFRFKLFIFSLKLSLGLCMKLFNRVDFPYIVDDMFDSSDFDNRKEIGNFFRKVVESHDAIIDKEIEACRTSESIDVVSKGKLMSNLSRLRNPQIIFLTQDELIADSLYEGLKDIQDVVYGRLCNPHELTREDIRISHEPSDNVIGGYSHRYLNLYDVIYRSF